MPSEWDCFGSDDSDSDSEVVPQSAPPVPPARAKTPWAFSSLVPEAAASSKQVVAANAEASRAPAYAPFAQPPAYQHPALRYTELAHRGGGRGFLVDRDVLPGTLLLAEHRLLRGKEESCVDALLVGKKPCP